ncbi:MULTISPECIES: DUF1482 family protein [Enterobacter]|uniref:DUF1482 family protein n=1 Tax=Enterobacter TaxID=547 RepID=UPI000932295A|nr:MULTISPECIES: DUF1482 family protein [Enterobacter]MCQ4370026.1 DUF1482 family protein [Enterobacter asburiae]MDS1913298.1 DUF1482 family protein [Enterobacter asburiae]HDC4620406.1 DUF1482 family protein [Enterobacter asburiae]
MTQLFALVLTICSSSIDCTEVVKEVYDSQAECNQAIYEERLFNGACYPVEKIVRQNKADFAVN